MFNMDIPSSSSKPSTSVVPINSDRSSEEERDISSSKKPCISTVESEHIKKQSKYHTTSSSSRKYQKRWEKISPDLCMMLIVMVHSVNCVKRMENILAV